MAQNLDRAYRAVERLVGAQMEPMAVMERVEEHRAYWRPHRTRVVLLAESHVYTAASELTARLRLTPSLPAQTARIAQLVSPAGKALASTGPTRQRSAASEVC